jgi:Omp85 superfamily domain
MIRFVIAAALAGQGLARAQPSPSDDPDPGHTEVPHKADPEPGPRPDAKQPVDAPTTNLPPVAAPETPPHPTAPEPVPRPLQAEPVSPDDDVTSAKLRPEPRFDLQWRLLMLPEKLFELAFVPVGLLVGAIDQYALGPRFFDALDVFHDYVRFSPRFKFSFSDGLGVGLWVAGGPLFDNRAILRAGGLVRLNGDWQTELEYKHALLFPGGRALRLHSFISQDKNRRYYGLGGATTADDARVIRDNEIGAFADIDLQGIARYVYSGVAGIGVRRQSLSPGSDPAYVPLMPGDGVRAPEGFNQTATFIDATLSGKYDTRDALGRPSRGWLLAASALGRTDVTGKHLSALTFAGSATVHLPVFPDHRVLSVTLGGQAAYPLFAGDTIPLDSFAVIDRSNVRGYDRDRFRDRYAVAGTIEYRFPIYQYLATRAGLDAIVFFDAGTLWGRSPVREAKFDYSAGAGVRAGTENAVFFEADIARSPDGFQLTLGGEALL